MFRDRRDAGRRLAEALKKYKDQGVLVLAIPRGGVEVGYEVAKYLNADFSLVVTRKLPLPVNREAGFGAIAEDGSTFMFDSMALSISEQSLNRIVELQKREISRRVDVLREGKPLPKIAGRTVILIDDGIAMGSTMRATIMLCKNKDAEKIIAAAPVTGDRTASEIARLVDEVVILEKPVIFHAVAQAYDNWYDVGDDEVIEFRRKWEKWQTEREG